MFRELIEFPAQRVDPRNYLDAVVPGVTFESLEERAAVHVVGF